MPSDSDARPVQASPRSGRRAPGEVRELLLDAAEEIFSTHGYDYSSTKSIAERAGVAEALLFRHFGSKAQLFRAAIVEPLIEVLRENAEQWLGYDRPHSAEQPIHDFVNSFFNVISEKRGSALALTAASNYSEDVVEDATEPLAAVLKGQEVLTAQEAKRFGYQGLSLAVTPRVGIGSVLASAAFRNWLFATASSSVSDSRIIKELESMMMHGLRHRPPHDQA